MRSLARTFFIPLFSLAMFQGLPAFADSEIDALSLESDSVKSTDASNTKMFVEGAIGNASQRYQPGSLFTRRASFDLLYSGRIGPGLRAVFSNRIDNIHPTALGADTTVNSLREAYLSWQTDGGNAMVELGRINLRNGPGYGYNPTDFFRDGSVRVLTSADPFALRQNRLGSVMLRAQRLWSSGSISLAYSPKLATQPSANGWSLDLGSTNNRNRGIMTIDTKFSQNLNSQVMLYKDGGRMPTVGVNSTALLSDAAVAHFEWSRGREPDLASRALALSAEEVRRNRFVGGITYTTLGKTSITAEYQYNGFGLDKSGFAALSSINGAQLAYLREALRLQELAPRSAYLVYVTQKSLGLKDLDLTAYLRLNPADKSRLAWLELRHHWPNFDLSLQMQRNIGRVGTEFGILPDKSIFQVLGKYYF